MEGRGDGLTTEDLAGARAGREEDLRIEDEQRREADREADTEGASSATQSPPIAVGPVEDPPIILEDKQGPDTTGERTEPLQSDADAASEFSSDRDSRLAPPPPAGVAPEKDDVSRESQPQGSSSPSDSAEGHQETGPLLGGSDRDTFTERWKDVQFQFVEDPRTAVKEADELVAEVMQRLAQSFAEERSNLESQWSRGDQVSTEDLRQSLRRYRAFFDRLLGV